MLQGTLLALLGITLAGYVFSSTYINTKYRLSKFQGHHLLYKCLFVGGFFFLLSIGFYSLTWPLTSSSTWLFDSVSLVYTELTQQQFNLGAVLINAVLMSLLTAKIFNRITFWAFNFLINSSPNNEKNTSPRSTELALGTTSETINSGPQDKISRQKSDKYYEILVYSECTDNNYISHVMNFFMKPSLLLLTLESRRCYVCIPYDIKTPNDHEEPQDITIIPVYTGYRDQEDLCLELTTNYDEVISILRLSKEESQELSSSERSEKRSTLLSYRVTIPHGKIVSISSFDSGKYRQFKEKENKRRKDIQGGRDGGERKQERVVN